MKFVDFKNKKFNKQVEGIGKDIYEKVSAFVQENKGDDEKLYSYAMLKLSDGRIMTFSFPDMWESWPGPRIPFPSSRRRRSGCR